jgi:hypothetical protein
MTGFDTRFLDVRPNAETGFVLLLRAEKAPELDGVGGRCQLCQLSPRTSPQRDLTGLFRFENAG